MLKPDTSRLDYIQKVKLHIESQREERCSNQIPLDLTTYRKSAGGTVLKPRYLSTDYIQKVKFKLSWEERCSNQIPLDSTTYRKSNYIQKVSRRNGAQTKIPLDSDYIQKVKFKLSWEERCSNQIPLDSTTYRKSNYIQKVSRRNGAQTKIPLDSDLHTESQIQIKLGGTMLKSDTSRLDYIQKVKLHRCSTDIEVGRNKRSIASPR